MPMTKDYARFWWIWFFTFAAIELTAVFVRHRQGDTLSEFWWAKGTFWGLRILMGVALVWLIYHFLFNRYGDLGWKDALFAGLGALIGLLSVFTAKRWKNPNEPSGLDRRARSDVGRLDAEREAQGALHPDEKAGDQPSP